MSSLSSLLGCTARHFFSKILKSRFILPFSRQASHTDCIKRGQFRDNLDSHRMKQKRKRKTLRAGKASLISYSNVFTTRRQIFAKSWMCNRKWYVHCLAAWVSWWWVEMWKRKMEKVKKGRRQLFEYYYFKFNIYSFVQLQLLALSLYVCRRWKKKKWKSECRESTWTRKSWLHFEKQ